MRQTIQEIKVNNAYRWFLGLGLHDPVLHFSTFGKNYMRRFKDTDLFEHIFQKILKECMEAGLVDESVVFVDSTHVKARANGKKYVLAEKTELIGPSLSGKTKSFIEHVGPHPVDEELLYCYGLAPFLERFSEKTDFTKEEPAYLNRHWICHGRMNRELRQKDFYQLLAAFYALISIAEWQ